MWAWGSDGSWWVHSNFVIRVTLEINTHFVTTFPAPKGEVPIIVSPPINDNARLVSFRDDIVAQSHSTYFDIFQPYGCRRQREMFHPSAVGVCQLICNWHGYIFCGISPKRSGQWRYWYIVKVRLEMRDKCRLINCNLLFFSFKLFNFIARVWFNSFARNYTLILLFFVEGDLMIFLKIFLYLIFFFCEVIPSLSTAMFAPLL